MEKSGLLERRYYVNPAFPCSILRLESNRVFFQTHWHDEIEILHAVSGQLQLILDGIPVLVPTGGFAIVNSGQLHTGFLTGSPSGIVDLIVFHPELWLPQTEDERLTGLVDALLSGAVQLPTLWRPDQSAAQPVLRWLRALLAFREESGQSDGRQLALRGLLCLLLAAILDSGVRLTALAPEQGDRRNQVQRIKVPLAWLHAHYASEVRLAELAHMANYSESHFSRVFRQILGQSVIAYLVDFRLRQAARLLAGTDAPIMAIAASCGFDNQGYFCRSFKKRYRMAPGVYRAQNRSGETA